LGKPPIYTFIFTVVYNKLAPYKNFKGDSNHVTEYVKKIWAFTQEYVKGLYELAKNIVEHSSTHEGMITIRAYDIEENDDVNKQNLEIKKVLETHVFDYGDTGIITKMKDDTKALEEKTKINYDNSKEEGEKQRKGNIYNVYKNDVKTLCDNYTIANFIDTQDKNYKELEQQTFRDLAHFGLQKFHNLVKTNNGEMFLSSCEDFFPDVNKTENRTINRGTSYFFQIPFNPKQFDNKDFLSSTKMQENKPIGTAKEFEELMKIELISIRLDTEADASKEITDKIINPYSEPNREKVLVDLKIKGTIIDRDTAQKKLYPLFTSFKTKKGIDYIAIDMDKLKIDISDLFRFLSHLSNEYNQSIIIYNLEYDDYKEMIADVVEFYESRYKINDVPFWYENKSILLFLKRNNFYYADILFGQNGGQFIYINQVASLYAENTIVWDTNFNQKYEQDSNFSYGDNLSKLFHNNLLLPFDTVLKNSDDKPIFLSSLKERVERDINHEDDRIEGYKINSTHFRIGSKVHTTIFYYAKRLFQNSYHTLRLAFYLAGEIKRQRTDKEDNITLIGYENYSELLLSLTQNFLIDAGYTKVTHFYTLDIDDKIEYRPTENFLPIEDKKGDRITETTCVIIIPIASTGSTALKIKENIEKHKEENNKYKDYKINYLDKFAYNILQASDQRFSEILEEDGQETMVSLGAEWEFPGDCSLCFDNNKSKPLFETDKSSLTPSLIFSVPNGKKEEEKPLGKKIDEVTFDDSLIYRTAIRNKEHYLFSTFTPKLINDKNNRENIVEWLGKVKDKFGDQIKPTDRIVIISPSHETNMEFVTMVNTFVFNSSATIIHHQIGVDYLDNFRLLYGNLFQDQKLKNQKLKVFYVDDSLISGKSFFTLYDLLRQNANRKFDAIILLNDKTSPEIQERVKRTTIPPNQLYSFLNYNLPPALNISDKNPLEYERIRYKQISESVLHDTLAKHFHNKAQNLIESPKQNQKPHVEKQKRHIMMFKITHKIYEYFASNSPKEKSEKEEKMKRIEFIEQFIDELNLDFKDNSTKIEKEFALMKVLSQYPFLLYKPLREQTFVWHKYWLNKLLTRLTKVDKLFYNDVSELKFVLRRAVFLENYYVVDSKIFELIGKALKAIDSVSITEKKIQVKKEQKRTIEKPDLFGKIEEEEITEKIDGEETVPLDDIDKENLKDFHIFLVQQYVELIHKNGWCAKKILENIDKVTFSTTDGAQFVRMLKIEAAMVMHEFYNLILFKKEYKKEWKNIFKYVNENGDTVKNSKINNETRKIIVFFDNKTDIIDSNKLSLCKEILGVELLDNTPFANYLWIKQLLTSDMDEKRNLPTTINYRDKINAILKKMEGIFDINQPSKVSSFLVVSDRDDKNAYALADENNCLWKDIELKDYKSHKESEYKESEYKEMITFLIGQDNPYGAKETIMEYSKKNDIWYNDYYKATVNLNFLKQDIQWLLLIRISNNKDKELNNTLGLLGFYGTEVIAKNCLPKQLLMLLRRDMGEFIKIHHKNDEFTQLLLEENRNRFAYLAGHGRQMLQDLIAHTDNGYKFANVVGTMNKLQYIFATEKDVYRRQRILKEAFPYENNDDNKFDKDDITCMANTIYETKYIENEVCFDLTVYIPNTFNFNFNADLIRFFCFELIVNAKKNRFHDIKSNKISNTLGIDITISDDQKLIIKVVSTGAKFDDEMKNRINDYRKIKEENEVSSGIALIRAIISAIDQENEIKVPESEKTESEIYKNTITITLNKILKDE
jgi:hypothetical protein